MVVSTLCVCAFLASMTDSSSRSFDTCKDRQHNLMGFKLMT